MHILTGHIEELVLTALLKDGSLRTSELLEKAFRKRQYTKQGVYRVLRKLKAEEKVVIYKSTVSINNFWREQLQSLLDAHDSGNSIVGDVRELQSGDRLSLKLRGLSAADQVWSHLFIPIEKWLSNRHPLFLYNQHNWTGLLRKETDRVHVERLERSRRPTYLTIGSIATLDKAVTRTMESKYFEHSFNAKLKFSFYIAVIGDFVFQMKLLGNGDTRINTIFSEKDAVTAKSLMEKADKQILCRIIVEKNATKAASWKKRLGKDFYIPKKYRHF